MTIFNVIVEDREWGEVEVYSFTTYEKAIEKLRLEMGNALINLLGFLTPSPGGIKLLDSVPANLNEIGLVDGLRNDIELLEDYPYDVFCETFKEIVFYNGDDFSITLKESELN